MKIFRLFTLLLTILLPLYGAKPAAQPQAPSYRLVFNGKPGKGDSFLFEFRSQRIRTKILKLPGVEKPPEQRSDRVLFLNASLSFLSESEFLCRIHTIRFLQNGTPNSLADLAGRTMRIRTHSNGIPTDAVLLPVDPADVARARAGSVLNGTVTAESSDTLTTDALVFFQTVFAGSPGDAAAAYLGTARMVCAGDRWTPSAEPILRALQARGIEERADLLRRSAEFTGFENFYGIPCGEVKFLCERKTGGGYDFKVELTFLFPKGKAGAGPLRVSRSAFEMTSRVLPPGSPLFSGNTLELLERDLTDIQMIPRGK